MKWCLITVFTASTPSGLMGLDLPSMRNGFVSHNHHRRSALAIFGTFMTPFPSSPGASWALTEEDVANAAKARAVEVQARIRNAARTAAIERAGFVVGAEGLRYRVKSGPSDPTSPTPVRGQSVRLEYTLSVGGFTRSGEPGAVLIDDSRGLFKVCLNPLARAPRSHDLSLVSVF